MVKKTFKQQLSSTLVGFRDPIINTKRIMRPGLITFVWPMGGNLEGFIMCHWVGHVKLGKFVVELFFPIPIFAEIWPFG